MKQKNGTGNNIRSNEDAIVPGTLSINWVQAKTGWTKYYDDGLITTNPDVFFKKREGRKNYE